MHYVIFTFCAEGAPIALKLQEEGFDVTLAFIESKSDIMTAIEKSKDEPPEEKRRRLSLYDGMLDKYPARRVVEMLKKVTDKKDYFLFFDLNIGFKFAEELMGLGFQGNFPTHQDRLMEVDRDMAKEFVEKHYKGLDVAEHHEFKTIEEGKAFMVDSQDIWVLKGKDVDAKTFVPVTEDPDLAREEVEEALEHGKKEYEKAGFILERKIPDVLELTPEIQFYDGVPLFASLDLENKQIGAGNLGEMTGCAQDLVFPIPLDCPLAKIAFPDIVYEMAKSHRGLFVWDASILIDPSDDKMYFGEFCSNRCGYNAFYTQLAVLPKVSTFFEAVVAQENPFARSNAGFGASVRLFNIPREYSGLITDAEIRWKDSVAKDVWLMDGKKEDDSIVDVGYSKDLAVATGCGDTPDEAAEKAYETIDGFSFVNLYYRYDFLHRDFPNPNSAIMNRYQYAMDNQLI